MTRKRLTLADLPGLFTPVMNFPMEGIRFWNVNDLTATPGALTLVTDEFVAYCRKLENYHGRPIDYIGGFDARGFIFGASIAERLGIGFLQIRKKGKLPKPTVSFSYTKEYSDPDAPPEVLEMNETNLGGKLIVLVDDLLATGGTAEAGCMLVEAQGGIVAGFLAVTDLPSLGGRKKLQQYHCHTLLTEISGKLCAGVRYCVDAGIFDAMTNDLVLIKRLSIPTGLAMVGGGIEVGESPRAAICREIWEETGCTIDPAMLTPVDVLVGADRDPRGNQVSIVYNVRTNTHGARGEAGKTQVLAMSNRAADLPALEAFAFSDHRGAILAMMKN
jgi:adenine phosphoribosyltransferase